MTRDEMIQLTRELTGRQYTSLPKSFDELQEYTDRVISAALAEPVEPVAYRFQSPATEEWLLGLEPPVGSRWEVEPLYTAPPQRKPLTEEEIDELSRTMVKGDRSVNWLCRAIERAHGIGDNT